MVKKIKIILIVFLFSCGNNTDHVEIYKTNYTLDSEGIIDGTYGINEQYTKKIYDQDSLMLFNELLDDVLNHKDYCCHFGYNYEIVFFDNNHKSKGFLRVNTLNLIKGKILVTTADFNYCLYITPKEWANFCQEK